MTDSASGPPTFLEIWLCALFPGEHTYIEMAASRQAKAGTAYAWIFLTSFLQFSVYILLQGSYILGLLHLAGIRQGTSTYISFHMDLAIVRWLRMRRRRRGAFCSVLGHDLNDCEATRRSEYLRRASIHTWRYRGPVSRTVLQLRPDQCNPRFRVLYWNSDCPHRALRAPKYCAAPDSGHSRDLWLCLASRPGSGFDCPGCRVYCNRPVLGKRDCHNQKIWLATIRQIYSGYAGPAVTRDGKPLATSFPAFVRAP